MRNAALLLVLAALAPISAAQLLQPPPGQPAGQPGTVKPEVVINGQPADAKPAELSVEQKAELAKLHDWLASFYKNPEPDKVGAAFADLSRLGELNNSARGWPTAAIIGELIKQYPDRTEEWCRAFDVFEEPDRHWFFTGVWFAGTEQAKSAIASRAELPEGNARRLTYNWVKQAPQNILERRIRGPQQIEMLLGCYGITGKTEYLGKLIDALDDPPKDDPKITEKGRERLTRVIAAVQVSLARACRRDPAIKEFCAAQVQARKAPISGRIEELLKKAEGTEPIADAPPIIGQ